MSALNVWSIALFVISVAGLELSRRNVKWGWRYAICNQAVWFVYGWQTGQWGSMALAVVFVGMYFNNLRSWRHASGRPETAGCQRCAERDATEREEVLLP